MFPYAPCMLHIYQHLPEKNHPPTKVNIPAPWSIWGLFLFPKNMDDLCPHHRRGTGGRLFQMRMSEAVPDIRAIHGNEHNV